MNKQHQTPNRRGPAHTGNKLGSGRSAGLMTALLLATLVLPLAGAGCASKYIGDTKITNTHNNRVIMELVEEYRQAMESRDGTALKGMMSKRYYENASTTATTEDDWGYPDSEPVLSQLENQVKSVTYSIKVTRLDLDGPRANVYFDYTWSFLYSDGARDRWGKKSDVNRLELVMENDKWKVLSGM